MLLLEKLFRINDSVCALRGKINSIDDEAIKYFKDFDHALLGKTTIRHLVTHSHGLGETNDGKIFREFKPDNLGLIEILM